MPGKRIGLIIVLALILGGCPSDTTSEADPTTLDWLSGDWLATATATGESVSGCLTIGEGQVQTWGHGCTGENMTILDAPLATVSGSSATVAVTVLNTSGSLMQVTMYLTHTTDDLLTGSITTVSLGQAPYFGTVTLRRL